MKKTSVEEIATFCDNWTGQSKNRIIHQMLLSATIKIENLNNVQLIFLGKGHTQNCNDSIHSPIKKAKKGINIHYPGQWNTGVQMACKNQPYVVERMPQK